MILFPLVLVQNLQSILVFVEGINGIFSCSWYLSCVSTSVAWYLNIYIKLHFKRHCEFGIFNNVLLILLNLPIYIALALLGLLTNYTWLNSSNLAQASVLRGPLCSESTQLWSTFALHFKFKRKRKKSQNKNLCFCYHSVSQVSLYPDHGSGSGVSLFSPVKIKQNPWSDQ